MINTLTLYFISLTGAFREFGRFQISKTVSGVSEIALGFKGAVGNPNPV